MIRLLSYPCHWLHLLGRRMLDRPRGQMTDRLAWTLYCAGHWPHELWKRTRRHVCAECGRRTHWRQFLHDERAMCLPCWDAIPDGPEGSGPGLPLFPDEEEHAPPFGYRMAA